jgi:hypothetical protein
LEGTFSVTNGVATAQIDMIEGQVTNPFSVIDTLSAIARANGAETLNIQGTLANDRLLNILNLRYGATSQGSLETISIPLTSGGP